MIALLNKLPEESRMEAILTYIDNQVSDSTFSDFMDEMDIEVESALTIDDALSYIRNQKSDGDFIEFLTEYVSKFN